jgi:uncharacterized protein (DUF924 family)
MATKSAEQVYKFWFIDHGMKDWFGADPEFDAKVHDQFAATFECVARGEAAPWRSSTQGRVAEIIVLDQFSRQLFRGQARAFATDGMALVLAQEAVANGHDQAMNETEQLFAYMPFMHSESIAVHQSAQHLFEATGNTSAQSHLEVLEKFGRYPKRNAALGRKSTPEEEAYITKSGDSMF